MTYPSKKKLVIGIDPGTKTGVAKSRDGELYALYSMCIFEALAFVIGASIDYDVLVIFEDARKRKWFGKSGREKLQGAGSIKRDCAIWEETLTLYNIPFLAKAPEKGTTKWNKKMFQKVTGYEGETNEHMRDAGILVYGVTYKRTEAMIKLQNKMNSS